MIAVTGPHGRLAKSLISLGCVPLDCDVSDFEALQIELERVKPDIIIHAAGYTKVDEAENEIDKAIISNVRATGNLRILFNKKIAYISTSYVFDGQSGTPYSEDAEPNPLGRYAWSKLGGEQALTVLGMEDPNKQLIVRTISLFGPEGNDFVSSVRQQFEEGETFHLPGGLYSNPTYTPYLAEGIISALNKGVSGILNICGRDTVSRYDWGVEIAKVFRYNSKLLRPMSVIMPDNKAPRPRMAGLSIYKASKLRIPLFSMRQGLETLKRARR